VALVETDVSEERIASINKMKRISKLRTALAVELLVNALPSSLILLTFITEAIISSEPSIVIRATRRQFPEGDILQIKDCSLRFP
jgi:hypothetical protein